MSKDSMLKASKELREKVHALMERNAAKEAEDQEPVAKKGKYSGSQFSRAADLDDRGRDPVERDYRELERDRFRGRERDWSHVRGRQWDRTREWEWERDHMRDRDRYFERERGRFHDYRRAEYDIMDDRRLYDERHYLDSQLLDRYRLDDPYEERCRIQDIYTRREHIESLEQQRIDRFMERRKQIEESDPDLLRLKRFSDRPVATIAKAPESPVLQRPDTEDVNYRPSMEELMARRRQNRDSVDRLQERPKVQDMPQHTDKEERAEHTWRNRNSQEPSMKRNIHGGYLEADHSNRSSRESLSFEPMEHSQGLPHVQSGYQQQPFIPPPVMPSETLPSSSRIASATTSVAMAEKRHPVLSLKNDNEHIDEKVVHYRTLLSRLTTRSKELINMLTMVADEYNQHAPDIVKVIEDDITKRSPEKKLVVLYLVDSIMKNLPKSSYKSLFCKNIVKTFTSVFEKVDKSTKVDMFNLRKCWTSTVPSQQLYIIDVLIKHHIDPKWPVIAEPPQQTNIHINSKFLAKTPKAIQESKYPARMVPNARYQDVDTPSSQTRVKLSYLNIRGLKSKLSQNPDVKRYIRKNDIICFAETNTKRGDPPRHVTGYKFIDKPRKIPDGANASGGIGVYVKEDIKYHDVGSTLDYVMWLQLSILGVDVLLGALYIPPETSKVMAKLNIDLKTDMKLLLEEIKHKISKFKYTILVGDLNAHTSELEDFKENGNFESYIKENPNIKVFPKRKSADRSAIDDRGLNFIDLCKDNDLIILNGRAGQDAGIGKYTYTSKGKNNTEVNSVIDYIIVSTSCLVFFKEFAIKETNISDGHAKLNLILGKG